MLKAVRPIKNLVVAGLFGLALAIASISPSFLHVSAAKPAGNNGTIKIDNDDITGNDNNPHSSCGLTVEWFGFDAGLRTTSVSFDAQPPTGSANLLTDSFTFIGSGTGNNLDTQHSYDLTSALSSYAPQPQQGYHVKVTVTTDSAQGNDSKSKVFWLTACEQTKTATATTPLATSASCEVPAQTIVPPVIAGISWSPSTPTVLQPGDSITYTATADTGYALADGSQNSWSFTNNFDDSNCGQVRGDDTISVTPTTPFASEPSCEVKTMSITPPAITGVVWTPANVTELAAGDSITYVATPDSGYSFPGQVQTSWSFTNNFNDSDCGGEVLGDTVTVVKPGDPDPTFTDATCTEDGFYTVVGKEGVIYKDQDGVLVDPGSYKASIGDMITITAYPVSDAYELSEGTFVWSHTFVAPSCPQVLGDGTSTPDDNSGHVLGATTTLPNTGASAVLPSAIATLVIIASIATITLPRSQKIRLLK